MYLYVYICSVYTHMRTYTCADTLIHTLLQHWTHFHLCLQSAYCWIWERNMSTWLHRDQSVAHRAAGKRGADRQTWRWEPRAQRSSWVLKNGCSVGHSVSPHTSAELEESIICAENQLGGGEWRGGQFPPWETSVTPVGVITVHVRRPPCVSQLMLPESRGMCSAPPLGWPTGTSNATPPNQALHFPLTPVPLPGSHAPKVPTIPPFVQAIHRGHSSCFALLSLQKSSSLESPFDSNFRFCVGSVQVLPLFSPLSPFL